MDLVLAKAGNQKGSVQGSDAIFNSEYNDTLVHQVLVGTMANQRKQVSFKKNRSNVSGGGAKPHAQKGTGRARAGTSRNPLWRGGGATFGNQRHNYSKKINKKVHRAAMRSIYSELNRTERLFVIEDFKLEKPSTKDFLAKMADLGIEQGLVIDKTLDMNLLLSSRNAKEVAVDELANITAYELIKFKKIYLTQSALAAIEESLQ